MDYIFHFWDEFSLAEMRLDVYYVQINYHFISHLFIFSKNLRIKREMEKEILGTIVAKRKFAKREYEVMSLQR